jgi:predicted RNA-binding Zn ribbon-like protein
MPKPSWSELTAILLNREIDDSERDDAAISLREFDDEPVRKALSTVAAGPDESAVLVDTCGESLAEIWCRRRSLDRASWNALRPEARLIADAIVRKKCPDLLVGI